LFFVTLLSFKVVIMADSYSQGGAMPSYNYGYGSNISFPGQQQQQQPTSSSPASVGSSSTSAATTLRRRQYEPVVGYNNYSPYNGGANSYYGGDGGTFGGSSYENNGGSNVKASSPRKAVVKKLDFMFPKVESEYTVRTDSGGITSLIAYGLIIILSLAEIITWISTNGTTVEHVVIADTTINKRMRVNVNVTFPGLACEDLHVDIMDIAGDSQLDVDDTLMKRRLNRRGLPMGEEEILKLNKHRLEQDKRSEIQQQELPDDYCGPCYGADPVNEETKCCNTCDELIEAYKKKRWRHDTLIQSSEQCIREGKDKLEPKRMKHGEGCNLSGFFSINRVGGNFHIAMGEGIERDGRHIHTFNPDDTHNFNASHIIHHLSFGPELEDKKKSKKKIKKNQEEDRTTLDGVTKIVDKSYGTTGLFQYFIKVVPTTYMSDKDPKMIELETNRYFFTERFRPLMKELLDDDAYFHAGEEDEEDMITDDAVDPEVAKQQRKERKVKQLAAVNAGHTGGHGHKDHHDIKNAVLPGVFFIYEIYPFNVEISNQYVPFTHLLIRLMATIGGVITIMKLIDTLYYSILDHHYASSSSNKRQF
jgi:endoplasmic reticulum-Golgi intermediate compartment protein 3